MASKGCIFQPQELTWEDVDGGLGETIVEQIDEFVADDQKFDDPERYYESYCDFVEEWNGFTTYCDYKKLYVAMSLIRCEYETSWTADKLKNSLLKSMTKAELLSFMCRAACFYAWYAELVIHTV